MSRTKDAIWDELEKQHHPLGQPSDVMASKQIEIDQQAAGHLALQELTTVSEKEELEF